MLNINSYPIWIYTSLLFLQLTSSMVYLGIPPILPFIQQELHLSMVQIGYLAAAATFRKRNMLYTFRGTSRLFWCKTYSLFWRVYS